MKKNFAFSFAFLSFITVSLSLRGTDYYLDNERGNDSNPGTEKLPFRTEEKAMSALRGSDTLFLVPNKTPYKGRLNIRFSGSREKPTVIDGRGCRFSGLTHREKKEWKAEGNDVYSMKLPNNAWIYDKQGFWSGFPIVFIDGETIPWKKSYEDLTEKSYFLRKYLAKKGPDHNVLYVKLEKGKTPADVKIETAGGDSALVVEGKLEHIVFRNIHAEYYCGDGFDTAFGRDLVCENLSACFNMDQGTSAHSSDVLLRNCYFHHNAGGSAVDVAMGKNGRRPHIVYENSVFGFDYSRQVELHSGDFVFRNCIILGSNRFAIEITENSTALLENCVLLSAEKKRGIGIGVAKGRVDMRNCLIIGFDRGICSYEEALVKLQNCIFVNCQNNFADYAKIPMVLEGEKITLSPGMLFSGYDLRIRDLAKFQEKFDSLRNVRVCSVNTEDLSPDLRKMYEKAISVLHREEGITENAGAFVCPK